MSINKKSKISLLPFLRNRILFVLLCDTVAQGLIQPLTGPDHVEPAPPGNKGKNKEKEIPKTSNIHRDSPNSAVQQDVCNALKVFQLIVQNICRGYNISFMEFKA